MAMTTGMATRFAVLRGTGKSVLGFNRLIHAVPQAPPLTGTIVDLGVQSAQPVLPEFTSPSFSFGGGSLELMAVPKRRVRSPSEFSVYFDFLLLLGTVKIL